MKSQVMKKKNTLKKILLIAFITLAAGISIVVYSYNTVSIKSIQLSSPDNYAFQEQVDVSLDKKEPVFIKYWKEGSDEKFKTTVSPEALNHSIRLLLLETNSTYHYQVIVDRIINVPSKVFSFHTRKQSPWLVHNWVKDERPHDAGALGNGLVMLCNARLPGYIAMIDGKGAVRWYWQTDDIGVRAATITPRGTILAMLRPPMKDEIDDTPKENIALLREMDKPTRRGAMGFAGGTGIAEIDLTGKQLWRIDMDTVAGGKYKIIHHDVRMDKNGHVVTLIRTAKPYDMSQVGGKGMDTLGGDGILVTDTTGKVIWHWDVWDVWDIKNDPFIQKFAYDRFHLNSLNFDTDGNYLVSVAIEDQIWKINARTGKIMWKLGKDGDFKMDTTNYFSFQHSVHINRNGDLMVFDNSLWRKESGTLSFSLDTVNMIATTKIHAILPKSKYSSRMGSGYLLPNDNILQTSSKTGSVMVTDQKGNILWELGAYFVPYRSEYIPEKLWDKYFVKD